MRLKSQKIILSLCIFLLTACGNKVPVKIPNAEEPYRYPAVEFL